MDPDHSSAASHPARFDPTRWAVVLEAAQSSAQGGPQALVELCAHYWPPRFRMLKCFLREGGGRAGISYEEAARTLNLEVTAVKTLVHRMRQRHAQLMRVEVERTVPDPAEVDAEWQSLSEALLAAEGRVGA